MAVSQGPPYVAARESLALKETKEARIRLAYLKSNHSSLLSQEASSKVSSSSSGNLSRCCRKVASQTRTVGLSGRKYYSDR